jgi:Uncharacterized protein conserved in bacteria (DUF2188)/TIR domain
LKRGNRTAPLGYRQSVRRVQPRSQVGRAGLAQSQPRGYDKSCAAAPWDDGGARAVGLVWRTVDQSEVAAPFRGPAHLGRQAKSANSSTMPENYDVSMSFTAADRDVARRIADALKANGIRVIFDKPAGPELWGRDLSVRLRNIFEGSRICTVLISESYQQSEWAQLEWRSLLAHSRAKDSFSILPIKISDSVDEKFLQGLVWIDYSESSLPRIVEEVQRRLNDMPLREEDSSLERYHVIRRDTGWSVKRQGSSRARSIHKTQQEAIEAAKQITLKNKPAEIVVHRADGTIQSREQLNNE